MGEVSKHVHPAEGWSSLDNEALIRQARRVPGSNDKAPFLSPYCAFLTDAFARLERITTDPVWRQDDADFLARARAFKSMPSGYEGGEAKRALAVVCNRIEEAMGHAEVALHVPPPPAPARQRDADETAATLVHGSPVIAITAASDDPPMTFGRDPATRNRHERRAEAAERRRRRKGASP